MAKKQTRSSADPLTDLILEKLGPKPAAAENFFAYSVKIVCGKQADTNCCCVAGTRPGVYATEVNIQNLNREPAPIMKLVVPLINSGAVVAREPKFYNPALPAPVIEDFITLPPWGATMDDCCRIAELLLGGPPSGDTGLIIALLTLGSWVEVSVSAVYTANPLNGDGISIDVEYIPSRQVPLR